MAKGTLLAVFEVEGYPDYRPGSYFWVELPDRGHQDEKGLRRHITIVTSPTERGVVGLATRLRDTAFKRTLAELEPGDEVQVEEPKGSFLLPEDTSQPYVFVAGGIGITVFRSMLRYIADTGAPYDVTLLYSNRDRGLGRVPRRARRAGGADRRPAGRPHDDRRRRVGGRAPPHRRGLPARPRRRPLPPDASSSPARPRWPRACRSCSPPPACPRTACTLAGSPGTNALQFEPRRALRSSLATGLPNA